MATELLEGSDAIARAMVAAGCRFFSGYPMTPFTEVLERMGTHLAGVDGVVMNAESELEAVGMAWGAAATGTRAATGSTGQGLSLMQESLSEMTLARVPLVVLNMGRAQADYFQATRGGGHGDYRHVVLSPVDVTEAAVLVQEAFHLAELWRNPVVVYGDYYLAHTWQTVEIDTADFGPRPGTAWALDGSTGGTGGAKLLSPLGEAKQRHGVGYDLAEHFHRGAVHLRELAAGVEPRAETFMVDDAEHLLVAFGTLASFARQAVEELRARGHRVGLVRPITLWPFPEAILADAAAGVESVMVWENNQGQMLEDVRLSLGRSVAIEFIGGLSMDSSGFGTGPDITVAELVRRMTRAIDVDRQEVAR